jgi:hypothetical protein
MLKTHKLAAVAALFAATTTGYHGTLAAAEAVVLATPVLVSNQVPDWFNAYKAKMVSQAYKSTTTAPAYDVRAILMVYADNSGTTGQNIWIARSIDNGATWSHTPLTNNAGTPVTLTGPDSAIYNLSTTNGKPNIFAPATGAIVSGKGANTLVTWGSSYCRDLANPAQPSPVQKVNLNLTTGPEPYKCLWSARTSDGGASWTTQQITDGAMDVDEDVPAGFTTTNLLTGGFGIVWQADPAGLKQGQAEGPGEGASGASVSKGTNIWYTYLAKLAFESGGLFPTPSVPLSDNDPVTNTRGASRPNLAIVGGTAIVAYEETKGDSELFGKQIIYHSFAYNTPDLNSAGTIVSDPLLNSRRVRFLSQGDASAGLSPLRVVLLYRQTNVNTPGAESDVIMQRGLKNTTVDPLSTGLRPSDIEPFSVGKNLSNLLGVSATDNALAQRGVLRGGNIGVGFDYTPNMLASAAVPPTSTYNFYVTVSKDSGVTWAAPTNISGIRSNTLRVVEPRIVGTPGSILNPNNSATGDPADVQATEVFFTSYGTETNSATSVPQDIWITRTTNFGSSYEAKQLLAGGVTWQSETQLRSSPNGKNLQSLWMQQEGVVTDVYFRNGSVK